MRERTMAKKRTKRETTETPVEVPELEATTEQREGVVGLMDTEATEDELDAFVDAFNEMVREQTAEGSP
jgi:23S rRNA A2030 N6-methylase RlmJ